MKQTKTILCVVLIAIFVLSVGVSSAQPALAATTVMYIAPAGLTSGACDSWANACDLQYGLANAAADSELWVKAGTYRPITTTDLTATFQLKNGVALYGGFAGTETLRTQRNPATNVTILSGDIGTNDTANPITHPSQIVPGNSYHVVTGSGVDATAVLDGFTITAGSANTSIGGAGMYNNTGSPTLANIVFIGNIANFGGGMYNVNGSNPDLNSLTFNANYATDGAGMSNVNSNPTLTDVTFDANVAPSGYGGGMENNNSSPSLSNVVFSSNTAYRGGGVYNGNNSHPTLTNVTFDTNGDNNNSRGGGIYNTASSPTLTNVTFRNNTSGGLGGGIYNDLSNPMLTNVTFSGNGAPMGGGLYNWNSSPSLNHITFYDNSAYVNFFGGAIANFGDIATAPIMKNSIVWGNTPADSQIYNNGSTIDISYSVVAGGYAGTGNLSGDPLLVGLANYGGFTQTMALGAGSPAIDTADSATCASTDQRGVARPQGSACDMGAFELLQIEFATYTPVPTLTPPLSNTPTRTSTPPLTATPTLTKTPTETMTVTETPVAADTATVTPTRTNSLTLTPTATPTSIPGADFVGAPLSGTAPLTVQFTALNASLLSGCTWTFGDGNSQTFTPPAGQHFSVCPSTGHIYEYAGSYTVDLSVTKVTGASNHMTKTNYIQVTTSTPTVTRTPTVSPTPTQSFAATLTMTRTLTRTPTITPTKTATPTPALVVRTFISDPVRDGWMLESSENSGVGDEINSRAGAFNLGDNPEKKQYRSILSFSTGASLPDNAVITAITLKVKKQAILGGGNPVAIFGGFVADVKTGFFSVPALQASDFQTAASKSYGPFNTALVDGWYSINLTGAKESINKLTSGSGLTQIRLRFTLDDNNNAVANYLSLYSGNAPAGFQPQLIVIYHLP